MNTFKLKTLVAALALAGFASACDRNTTAQRDAYSPPDVPPVERSTTADGTTNPGALESLEQDPYATRAITDRDAAEIDHEETVQFTGTELTDASEQKLEDLAKSLDKDKPVAVIVAIQETTPADTNTSNAQPGTAREGTSTGDTSTRDMANTGPNTNTSNTSGELVNGAEFAQRVDKVREVLQEQGVEVVHWQFEGSESLVEERPQATHQPREEDIQQVRIVIADSVNSDTLGAL